MAIRLVLRVGAWVLLAHLGFLRALALGAGVLFVVSGHGLELGLGLGWRVDCLY